MGEFSLEVLFIIGLASFRATRLLVFDKITEFIRAPFLEEVIEEGEVYVTPKQTFVGQWIGGLLTCYWCTGFWVSLVLVGIYWLLPKIGFAFILVFAVAAIGSIIETIIQRILGD